MNLFVDALANYLITECDQVLKAQDSANKITLVVQSFPLADTVATIKMVDDFFVKSHPGTPRALKISLGLWNSWSAADKKALDWTTQTVQQWVDLQDQLVTFRNEGHCIFFGFDHASEKGSLKDFHLVNEELLWTRVLTGRFNKWVDQCADHLDDSDEAGKQHLLAFLESVDKFNPRNLSRISRFLCSVLAETPDSLRDAVRACYSRLPEWSAMPLVDVPVGRNLPRLNGLVDSAHRFSTHAMFTSRAEREKAVGKIDKAQIGTDPYPKFELPASVHSDATDYSNAVAYLGDVRNFIRDNDDAAIGRLKRWDATALLSLLAKPEPKGSKKTAKSITLKGYSDVVFLQAIQIALEDVMEHDASGDDIATIDEVTIQLLRYTSDGKEPRHEICTLLQGIVGEVIPEVLILGESGHDVKVVLEGLEDIVIPTPAKGASRVEFSVIVVVNSESVTKRFVWPLPATHPERLRLALAEQTLNRLADLKSPRLPVFQIGGFDEMFFAIDEDDANRLLLLGINEFKVKNVFDGLSVEHVSQDLVNKCTQLTGRYKEHLENIFSDGFYSANARIHRLIDGYENIVSDVIGHHILGAEQVLPRLYRSFLTVRGANDSFSYPYLDAALVLPISPFVLELSAARAVFLRDGFREVLAELFKNGRHSAQQKWQRLVGLAELRRPIVALVADANGALSTWSRSFGLTHLIGSADERHLSVASQSLMREDNFDEDDLGQKLKSTATSRIYERLIRDYQKLHHHANDQLSILFTHVQEIDVLLSGVDRWLTDYLTENSVQEAPFVLCVKVITTGVAATTALNMLVAWKNVWSESEFRDQRRCVIQIGHRHATSTPELNRMLEMEGHLSFDLAFLSHFMEGKHVGDQLEPAPSFDVVQSSALRQFPIAEYPRPAMATLAQQQRKTLISNRRFAMASKHTEISARLKFPQTVPDREHVVMTQIDFEPWKKTVALLHQKSLWVSCVDRYVDSHLLGFDGDRRIVGFSCGLGDYGELNQTVSTELNDLASLTRAIAGRLRGYLKDISIEQAELAARNVVRSASEIPGLSLVRAAGHDDYIRDVLGYSLINRLFGRAQNTVLQVLIPLDSFRHWFADRDDPNIPDLLLLSANLVDGLLDINATVVECKFASESQSHLEKAYAQASAGLRQLTRIFAPHGSSIETTVFERKYWWAQLHRALSSRAIVAMPHDKYRELCAGLERLGEGMFSISWRAVASTFWTDRQDVDPSPAYMGPVDIGCVDPLPNGFGVYQLQFGAGAVIRILTQDNTAAFEMPGIPLVLSAQAGLHNDPAYVELQTGSALASASTPDAMTGQNTAALPIPSTPSMLVAAPAATPAAPVPAHHVQLAPSASLAPHVPHEALAVTVPAGRSHAATMVDRILLGDDNRAQSVYWEYGDQELENRHLLIFGGSGSGKTYAIQCLLLELAKQGQHAAIIDYTDGFLPSHLDPVFVERTSPTTHVLVRQPFPINPFQRLARDEPGIGMLLDQPHNVASRVSDVFCSVYDVGDVQRAALAKHIELGLSNGGDFGLEELLASLSDDKDAPPTLALKIAELVKQKPFANSGESGWNQLFEGSTQIHILQLTNLSKDIQRLIAEFALWDFFAYATRHGGKNKPLPIVLDEVQNLDHRTDRALDKLLREGRKFGVGMVLATQTISNFNKEQRSRLFQSGHKLFFKPAETERREFAQILADVAVGRSRDEWVAELSKLGKGECWSIGPRRIAPGGIIRRDPVKLKISTLESR